MFDVIAMGLIYMIRRYGHSKTKTLSLRLYPHYLLFVLHPTTETGRAKESLLIFRLAEGIQNTKHTRHSPNQRLFRSLLQAR
jgi:hypothetical protein